MGLAAHAGATVDGPRITEDSLLAYAWLELACQAVSQGSINVVCCLFIGMPGRGWQGAGSGRGAAGWPAELGVHAGSTLPERDSLGHDSAK